MDYKKKLMNKNKYFLERNNIIIQHYKLLKLELKA